MHETNESRDGDYRFEGLQSASGTLFPNELLDRVMAHLTGAEFKVLAYIVRRTLGFKKEADTISLEQICSGAQEYRGVVLDAGTGLSKKTAIAALKGLHDKGVIISHKRPGKDNLPTTFALRYHGSPDEGTPETPPDGTDPADRVSPHTGSSTGKEAATGPLLAAPAHPVVP